mmetsp:Transcript_85458/g.151109  ORF Transcript_85458/g.151109 Transcript_85458/m.151109 type:complete len:621 (+) Transcript_85458:48-1910(+)
MSAGACPAAYVSPSKPKQPPVSRATLPSYIQGAPSPQIWRNEFYGSSPSGPGFSPVLFSPRVRKLEESHQLEAVLDQRVVSEPMPSQSLADGATAALFSTPLLAKNARQTISAAWTPRGPGSIQWQTVSMPRASSSSTGRWTQERRPAGRYVQTVTSSLSGSQTPVTTASAPVRPPAATRVPSSTGEPNVPNIALSGGSTPRRAVPFSVAVSSSKGLATASSPESAQTSESADTMLPIVPSGLSGLTTAEPTPSSERKFTETSVEAKDKAPDAEGQGSSNGCGGSHVTPPRAPGASPTSRTNGPSFGGRSISSLSTSESVAADALRGEAGASADSANGIIGFSAISGRAGLRRFSAPAVDIRPQLFRQASGKSKPSTEPGSWKAQIGAAVPDFKCLTTHGEFTFHEYLVCDPDAPWTLFLSHPKEFSAVSTTELAEMEAAMPLLLERKVKMIALTGGTSEEALESWSADVLFAKGLESKNGKLLSFPVVLDKSCEITSMLGLADLDASDGRVAPSRSVMIIGQDKKVKLFMSYPASIGRSLTEVVRVVDALKVCEEQDVSTPANWTPGERVFLNDGLSDEEAEEQCEEFRIQVVPSGKNYMRSMKCPLQPAEAKREPTEN